MDPRLDTKALVNRSGNSDVDVTVTVDTTPLAYALACYLYADGRLNDEQYKKMLNELDHQFKPRNNKSSSANPHSSVSRPWLSF